MGRARPRPFSKEDLDTLVERAAVEVLGSDWREKRPHWLKEQEAKLAATAQRAEKKQEGS